MIVNGDVDELPADAPGAALAVPVAGDAVADTIELAELLDVHMDDLAGPLAFIADHRFGWLQIPPAVEAVAFQNASDGTVGNAGLLCNTIIDAPLPAQRDDLRAAH